MATTVKVNMDSTQKILLKRSLNKNGGAQVFFTKECAKAMNTYVPFATGRLKDMTVELGSDFVKYNAPYARKQYYENQGNGKGGTSKGGLRGKLWDKRMWLNKGNAIVKKVANYCGVKSK